MTESALQTKVLEHLAPLGVWVNNSPSRWGKRGIPDIIGCWGPDLVAEWRHYPKIHLGEYIAIELKHPGRFDSTTRPFPDQTSKSEMAQAKFLQRVMKAGGIAIVADSLEEVFRCLVGGFSNAPLEF